VHLRGTGESFAANIGGRLIGTSFAFLVFTVTDERWQGLFPQALHGTAGFPMRVAYTTAAIGFFVFALGWFIAGKLPDPQYGNHEEEDSDSPVEGGSKTILAEDEEETTAPEDEGNRQGET
jgi:p-aminobenzoyl-glutamate transporter AbgT